MNLRKHIAASLIALAGVSFTDSLLAQKNASSMPIPVSWNETKIMNNDGTATSDFHVKMVNYVDSSGNWRKNDLTPKKDATGFHITDAPYSADLPLKANGTVKFTSNNRYSIKEKRIRDDLPVSSLKNFTTALPVNGVVTDDGVLYEGALPSIGADLLLQPHEMELRYLVVWNSLPPQCTNPNAIFKIPFTQVFDGGFVPRKNSNKARIKNTKESFSDGFNIASNSFRGIGTPIAHIWDSNGKSEVVEIEGKFNAPILDAAKVIHCSSFVDAVYPVKTDTTTTFFPNPSVEVTSVDGWVNTDRLSGTWAGAHALATGASASDTDTKMYAYVGRETAPGEYNIFRNFILFDTSSITENAVISAASISVTSAGSTQNSDDDGDDYIAVTTSTPASNTAITTADFDQVSFTEQHDAGERADWSNMNSADTVWTFDLNATGIGNVSKTDISKFALLEGHDIQNHPYAGPVNSSTNINVYSSDQTGTSKDPVLSVTYTLPSSSPKTIIIIKALQNLIPFAYASSDSL